MTEYLTGPELHQLTGYVLGPDAEQRAIGDYPGGGIYMLFDADGGLLYVGQSLDIGYRVIQHRWAARRGERLAFTHFSALDVPVNLMRHIECAHIHALLPPENHVPPAYWGHHSELVDLVKQAWADAMIGESNEH